MTRSIQGKNKPHPPHIDCNFCKPGYNHENTGILKSELSRDMNDCLGLHNEINQKILLEEKIQEEIISFY
ncbi:hypothetical protein SFRURICE_013695 [Spodoptera frugiperda]|nr:hypothetical protein SFRURICE_013695 [Spodoptera frugiperda]